MMRLSRLFEDQFDDLNISADELRDFAEDFLGRLAARGSDAGHGAAYAAMQAAIQPAFTTFDEALGARATLIAGQESGTISKNDALRLLRATVRRRAGRIRDHFDKGSAPYEEFFPRGLAEISKARLAQVPSLLDRLIAAATKYQTELGADLLTEFQNLKTTFTAARESQIDGKGGLENARQAVRAARATLQLVMGVQILELAKLHIGHPERASEFFDQSLLEDPTRSREDDEPPTPSDV